MAIQALWAKRPFSVDALVWNSDANDAGATSIEAHWLAEVAAPLCTFSEPLLEPPPVWDKHQDSVLARHEVTYGGHAWPLPHHSRLHPDMRQRCATFAAALLDGRVFPVLAGTPSSCSARPGRLPVTALQPLLVPVPGGWPAYKVLAICCCDSL